MEGPDGAEVTFQVVESGTQRGKRKLVSSDGFTFTLKRQNRGVGGGRGRGGGAVEWRCAIRNKTVDRLSGDVLLETRRWTGGVIALENINTDV